MLRLAVVGSRDFKDYTLMQEVLDTFIKKTRPVRVVVISGGAKGADRLAVRWAQSRNFPTSVFLPKWIRQDGSKDLTAGFARNKLIVDNCDVMFAFWDGKSRGTKNSIDLATKARKQVYVIEW